MRHGWRKHRCGSTLLTLSTLAVFAFTALGVAGCGTKKPPPEAQRLVKSAGQSLKGESPKLDFPNTTDDQATIRATFDDGSELEWTVVKDGLDWVLEACDAADYVGVTENCVPIERTPPAGVNPAFTDCVLGLSNIEGLWRLCDPLADPVTANSATAIWDDCRNAGELPGPCAFRIQGAEAGS
jgi:hypothetical protein